MVAKSVRTTVHKIRFPRVNTNKRWFQPWFQPWFQSHPTEFVPPHLSPPPKKHVCFGGDVKSSTAMAVVCPIDWLCLPKNSQDDLRLVGHRLCFRIAWVAVGKPCFWYSPSAFFFDSDLGRPIRSGSECGESPKPQTNQLCLGCLTLPTWLDLSPRLQGPCGLCLATYQLLLAPPKQNKFAGYLGGSCGPFACR